MATPKKTSKKASAKDEGQPSVNVGLVGHVDHGKTTLTERLSGRWTDTHSEEVKRGITIRLGYADASFYYCDSCKEYLSKPRCPECGSDTRFVRKVSFVDAPGHESLMATMLSGATIMDGALLLVAANEKCPQPQTREHLMALDMADIDNVVVVQNKVDVVSEERALEHYGQIKEFLKGTRYEEAPVIPVSAQHGANMGSLIQAVEERIPTPDRDDSKDPQMVVARSFDINKPGIQPEDLKGGVLGGAVLQGKLKVGDDIEISPGRVVEEHNQQVAKPLRTKVTGIMTGGSPVEGVVPGGSIALMTSLDPGVAKSNHLSGSVVGLEGKLPPVWYEFRLKTHLLDRVVGSQTDLEVEPVKKNEMLMLNVNAAATVGIVTDLSKGVITCRLKLPVCADVGSAVTISRRIGTRFRLIGYGVIQEK
ncbi:translation initiation factor IF-2 subunit gamma [Candidatus Woesearchaeota archaeon]|nr:translation initiation factor IF-2 subunit gamma [Candidatus Woesearchaeota archaeon]